MRDLASGLLEAHPTDQYRKIVGELCAAAGYPGIAADLLGEVEAGASEMVSPYSGRVWRIVRSLTRRAEEAGLSPEEEQAMIERAMENAERQAEMMFDADLRRRDQGESQT